MDNISAKVNMADSSDTWHEYVSSFFPSLHRAAFSGDLEEIKNLLGNQNHRELVDEVYSLYGTPLALAASKGHCECVIFLLTHGASVDVADMKGQTPLFTAVYQGEVECCRLLLNAGANTNGSPKNMCTPLHTAVNNGALTLIKLLVDYGADMEVCQPACITDFPATPLMHCVKFSCLDGLVYMLKAGANPNLAHHQDRGRAESSYIPALLFHALVVYKCPLELIHLLYECGGSLRQRNTDGLYSHEMDMSESLRIPMSHLFYMPRMLQSRCRVVIREHLGRSRLRFIVSLPVPSSLHNYLSMQDL